MQYSKDILNNNFETHARKETLVMYYGGMCIIKVDFAVYIGGKEALCTNV